VNFIFVFSLIDLKIKGVQVFHLKVILGCLVINALNQLRGADFKNDYAKTLKNYESCFLPTAIGTFSVAPSVG
jgi:hypothetical protein